MTDRDLLARIDVDPDVMMGKPVIRGTRLPVELVIDKLAHGVTIEELKEDYPFLSTDDVRAAMLYASKSLKHEEIWVEPTATGDAGRSTVNKPSS